MRKQIFSSFCLERQEAVTMKNVLNVLSYLLMICIISASCLDTPIYADTTTITVCSQNCDFPTIQEAIDASDPKAETTITLLEPIHTEAGIVINKDVIIQGQEGNERPIIQAHTDTKNAKNRVFLVEEGTNVVFKNLIIQHGRATFRLEIASGGAIYNYGNLLLEKCLIRQNRADDGGGILNKGNLTLKNCTLSDNLADGRHPDLGFRCGAGGAIKSEKGQLKVINCTIKGNEAAKTGGGIFVACKSTAKVENSTISGNAAHMNGGGIQVRGTLILNNSTVAQNTATRWGGGIYIHGKLEFSNTIIANNSKKDCHLITQHEYKGVGTIVTNIHNLIADQSCQADFSGDPQLGPLADNEGLTQTHALLPGSPAIDAIPAAECLTETDQRGKPRPGIVRSAAMPCDIGSFELQKP